jgi:oxygen-dependent protoporphyrinogen oxidase
MVGGAIDPGAADLDDDALLALVLRELGTTMGVEGAPARHWIFRYPRGIPQYVAGHGRRLAEVARLLAAHPGIHLAGNSYRGISVNAVIAEARHLRSGQTFRTFRTDRASDSRKPQMSEMSEMSGQSREGT